MNGLANKQTGHTIVTVGAVSSSSLLGLCFILDIETRTNYLDMFQNYVFPRLTMYVENFHKICFQQHDAPSCYSTPIHNYVTEAFNTRITGQCAAIGMPP